MQQITASGQKHSNTTKLTCTECDIYWVSAKLGSKKVIGIFKYLKYIVFAITQGEIWQWLQLRWKKCKCLEDWKMGYFMYLDSKFAIRL